MVRTVWLYAWVAVLSGLAIGARLPLEWSPKPSERTVTLQANWPGASPTVMAKIGSRIESSIAGASGTGRISSWASRGTWLAQVELSPEADVTLQRAVLFDRVASMRGALPRGVVSSVAPGIEDRLGEGALMTLQLAPDLARRQQVGAAADTLAERLRALPGVANVLVRGQPRRELRATVGAEVATSCSGCAGLVSSNLETALRPRVYGAIDLGPRRQLLVRDAVASSAELRTLAVPSDSATWHRLGRLASLGLAAAPRDSLSRIDGKPMVTLSVYRAPGSDILGVAERVHRELERVMHAGLGLDLRVADDRSEQVAEQLRDLVLRGGLGLCLVALVLLIMLRSVRATALCLFSVLLSFSLAFLGFGPLGLTLNVLTLAGLALLLGLLVDNAVVVIERMQASAAGRRPAADTHRARPAGVALPLVGATSSTCIVLLPLAYLSGELRELFMAFVVLASLVLALSLVVSLGLMPALGKNLRLEPALTLPGSPALRKILSAPYGLVSRFPKSFMVLLLLAIGLPVSLLPEEIEPPIDGWDSAEERIFAQRYNRSIGSELSKKARLWLDPALGGLTDSFLRNVEIGKRWDFPDRPMIRVWLRVPTGSDIGRVDGLIRPFEQAARECESVKRTLVRVVGREARLVVLFADEAASSERPLRLRERLIRKATGIAGIEISVSGLVPNGYFSGLGQVSGYQVHAFGPSYERLEQLSKELARRLSRFVRVARVDTAGFSESGQTGREVVRIHWDGDAVAETGISARQLATALGPNLWRPSPDFYAQVDGEVRMPVRVLVEGAESLHLEDLVNRPLGIGTGGLIRTADHAEIALIEEPPVIERVDQQYRRTLTVYYRGTYESGRRLIAEQLRDFRLPAGYRMETREVDLLDEVAAVEIWGLVLGAIGLVFLVVAAVLESWRLAVVVVLSVPLSWIGIASAFLLTGQNFSEGALLGVVLVIGIGVNDAILLVHRFGELRDRRPMTSPSTLALMAVRHRLKPMWTTTLTTTAGMLPMLVAADSGHFWQGLAVTVVGGLMASTLLGSAATVAMLGSPAFSSAQRPLPEDLPPRVGNSASTGAKNPPLFEAAGDPNVVSARVGTGGGPVGSLVE